MACFFTADLHFGRDAFFQEEWGERFKKWKTVEEMNEALIANWNEVVSRNDTVFIIGDFSNINNTFDNMRIWNRLNGTKKLILGNHDTLERLSIGHFPIGRVSFPSCTTVTIENWELFLSHYPTIEWRNKYKWDGPNKVGPLAIHLYGHVHDRQVEELEGQRAYNVCCDLNEFKPVSLDTILKKLNLTS